MEKQDKYIEEVKLNILKKQKGPENAKTLKNMLIFRFLSLKIN